MKNLIKITTVSLVSLTLLIGSVSSSIAGSSNKGVYKSFKPSPSLQHLKPSQMPSAHKWEEYQKCLELQMVARFLPGKGGCKKPGTEDMNDPWKPSPVPPVYNPMPPAHSGTTWEEYRECKKMQMVTYPPLDCKKPMIYYDTTDHGSKEQGKLCKVKVKVQCVKAPCLPITKWVPCKRPNHRPLKEINHTLPALNGYETCLEKQKRGMKIGCPKKPIIKRDRRHARTYGQVN